VFSSAVIIDIVSGTGDGAVEIVNSDRRYCVSQHRFMQSCNNIFDININPEDESIIKKVYSRRHTTLTGKAQWALGIVTGNNKEYIRDICEDGCEPVIKGRDIIPFRITEAQSFIRFDPSRFQQTANINFYRCGEKLVYRYISNRLILACDRKGMLTLNSANILIPEAEEYSMEMIMGLFNSDIYQFIFQKKFSSVKVLRSHIEELPLPGLSAGEKSRLAEAVRIAESGGDMSPLNSVVCSIYDITNQEADYIKKSLV